MPINLLSFFYYYLFMIFFYFGSVSPSNTPVLLTVYIVVNLIYVCLTFSDDGLLD